MHPDTVEKSLDGEHRLSGSEVLDDRIGGRSGPMPSTGASFSTTPPIEAPIVLDPLDPDEDGDEVVITTRRAIGRVALVAAETASRFQRDAVGHDPMAWLFAPRQVFDGAAAIDACLNRDDCLRGIILHGLGLGLDTDRTAVDALIAVDEGDEFESHEFRYLYPGGTEGGRKQKWRANRTSRLRLFTATIVDSRDNRLSQIFHASLARDAAEVRTRLTGRFGPDVADLADIRLGLNTSAPPVIALVPQAVVELIKRVERECTKPHNRTFSVDIELGIQA